mgnify:CR=1 FL=1
MFSFVMVGLFDMICIGLRQLRETEDIAISNIINACKANEIQLKDFEANPVSFLNEFSR